MAVTAHTVGAPRDPRHQADLDKQSTARLLSGLGYWSACIPATPCDHGHNTTDSKTCRASPAPAFKPWAAIATRWTTKLHHSSLGRFYKRQRSCAIISMQYKQVVAKPPGIADATTQPLPHQHARRKHEPARTAPPAAALTAMNASTHQHIPSPKRSA